MLDVLCMAVLILLLCQYDAERFSALIVPNGLTVYVATVFMGKAMLLY